MKELSNKVQDNYEEDNSEAHMMDGGTKEKVVYNSKLSKFVILSKTGDSV